MNDSSKDLIASCSIGNPWVWAVPVFSFVGLIVVWLTGVNESLFFLLNSLGQNDTGAVFWANITILGDTLVAFALLSLFVRRRPEIVWVLLIAAVLATFWVHGLKYLVGNPRPAAVLSNDLINVIGVNLRGGSFPSGHTTSAFVLAGVISCLRIHPLLSWIALLLASLTGISRAVVGAHWPMDIFAGALGGWLTAVLGVILFQQLARHKQWGQHIPGKMVFNIGLLLIALTLFFYNNGYPTSFPLQYLIGTIAILMIMYNFSQLLKRQSSNKTNNN